MIVFLFIVILSLSAEVGLLVSKWFFGVLALVFLGGMMVLFFYCLRLRRRVKPSYQSVGFFYVFPLFLVFYSPQWECSDLRSLRFYSELELISILFLTIYLIFTLLLTVKISENFKGSLIKLF